MSAGKFALRALQWTLIVIGVALIGYWIGMHLDARFGAASAIEDFRQARSNGLPMELPVDTALWAEGRIEEYRESLGHDFDSPLAILRIPRIDLEVAVLEGTSELVLNRGVGHVTGTALPGDDGNVGIAGHRDGYFRGLKDIAVGDRIEIVTLSDELTYLITELLIVEPPDVWVLNPTEVPSVTLVTCYPFYFVGSAPQRFIVRAERVSE